MIVSFALVWAYFLAFQGARRENLALHFSWKIALLVAVGALIFIFVRRVRRIVAALDFQKQSENKRR